MKFYEIPQTFDTEIDEFESLINRFQKGEITSRELKAHRVPFGIYEQRTRGTFMIRIRCSGGGVTPQQLKAVAKLSSRYGKDLIHITTRQGLQIHDVVMEDIIPIIRELRKVGLSSRGSGGNTVRNIMASWDAGISRGEPFDVTPYAVALTNRFISEPNSWLLPRKLKISFANSENDNALAIFNDLGFIAIVKNNEKGFRVYIAGGMGSKPRTGSLLHDFIPADQTYIVAEAVKLLFFNHGNRKNKHAARLRFLWEKLGKEKFMDLYQREFEKLKKGHIEPFCVEEVENRSKSNIRIEPLNECSSDFDLWKKRYVREQKQPGLNSILIPVHLGNIENGHAIELAGFLSNFGDNVLRCTMQQNLSIRNIPANYLGNVYRIAKAISDMSTDTEFMANCITCTGADTCQPGICLPQGALSAIEKRLKKTRPSLDAISDLRLHISGCPNTCGQHIVADIGFYGKSARKNQIMYPAYNIVAGSITENGCARLARRIDIISARDLPDFVAEFLNIYSHKKDSYTSFAGYIDDCGEADIRAICNKYRDIPDFDDDKSYYFDWGAGEIFSLVGKGMGECSAGLFDLIEVDRDLIKEKQKGLEFLTEGNDIKTALYQMTLSASRMLLITRGIESRSDREVFDKFNEHFIETGLVGKRFLQPVAAARTKDFNFLQNNAHLVQELANTIEKLYESMDDSLRFPAEKEPEKTIISAVDRGTGNGTEVYRDYRGVACPMNFVKIKLDIAMMAIGQRLKVLLDDGEPIENVSRSVIDEGHEILEQKKVGDYWSVLIQKE